MENIDINILSNIQQWLIVHFPRIVIIIIGMWLAVKSVQVISRRLRVIASDDDPSRESDREKRAATLSQILNTATKIIILSIGVIMIIKEVGIDIGPLLAGAGIIGLAIGFGSQALVKDVVTGFFILMEDQLRIGDVIKAAGHAGVVEKITLRTIVLRDLEGVMHVIPNGDVGTISNLTIGWSRAVLNIGIAYKENVDRAMEVILDEALKMANEEEWKDIITEPPSIAGVDSFNESSITIKLLIKTRPSSQWSVGREYRRRIKNRFDAERIELPFPSRTLSFSKEALAALRQSSNQND
ncbi:MAG: mechanosensitive ion channel family protein [candidate division Zixibacteria bacterium]|nr:mechanosensitive ion channel family protein [candidate division Zixibacteria bacterium]